MNDPTIADSPEPVATLELRTERLTFGDATIARHQGLTVSVTFAALWRSVSADA